MTILTFLPVHPRMLSLINKLSTPLPFRVIYLRKNMKGKSSLYGKKGTLRHTAAYSLFNRFCVRWSDDKSTEYAESTVLNTFYICLQDVNHKLGDAFNVAAYVTKYQDFVVYLDTSIQEDVCSLSTISQVTHEEMKREVEQRTKGIPDVEQLCSPMKDLNRVGEFIVTTEDGAFISSHKTQYIAQTVAMNKCVHTGEVYIITEKLNTVRPKFITKAILE